MSNFTNQQLTDVGWNALSTALGGGRLTFFKMQAGDGTIGSDADIPALTALSSPITDIGITNYQIEGEGQITLIGNIASSQIDTGFFLREIGVFATIEDPLLGRGGHPVGSGGVTAVRIEPILPKAGTRANPIVPTPSFGTAVMYSYCNAYDEADYIPGKTETTDVINTI